MATKRVEAAVETLVGSGVVTEDQLVHAAEVVKVLATLRGIEVGETSVGALGSGGKSARGGSGKKRKTRKRRGRLASVSDAEFKKLYQEMTARELGDRFGVSAGAVAARASKLGVKKNRASGAKKRGKKKASTKPRRRRRVKKVGRKAKKEGGK